MVFDNILKIAENKLIIRIVGGSGIIFWTLS